MPSINKTILIGHVGADPRVIQTKSGNYVTNFSLATSRYSKSADGTSKQETEWHRVVIFGKQAEIASERVKKGNIVYVEGRIHYDSFMGKDGQERPQTQIICENIQFFDKREPLQTQQSTGTNETSVSDNRDDVPF